MADAFISVPDIDTDSPIKKARTNTRTVSGTVVHEHFYILQDILNDTQGRILTTDPAAADGGVVVRPLQATHDLLNLNANIQVGNTDVAGGNPVPISGNVTANAGTNLNTSLLALESGGNLAAAAASLSVLDDWDESDRAKVNIIVGQDGVTGGAGAVAANTQRITHASDDPVTTSVQLIDDTVFTDDTSTHATGTTKGIGIMAAATPTDTSVNANDIGMVAMTTDRKLHVSVQDSLPAGTNAIGKLSANSGVDIGDVTIDNTSSNPVPVRGDLLSGDTTAAASTRYFPIAGVSAPSGVLNPIRASSGGTLKVSLYDTLDVALLTVPVSGTVAVSSITTSITPGSGAALLGKAEDLASAGGDTLVAVAGIRRDTPVANANVNADGDYTQLLLDNLGKLWTADNQSEDSGHSSTDRGSFILGVRNTSNTTSTSTDRDYAPISTDLWDAPISGMRRQITTLTAINTTYDDSPTTATSATVDSSMFRMGIFVAEVTESGTATDITFTLQMSPDGTTWHDYRVGPWVKYRFDDATIAAHTSNTLKICEPFMIECSNIRMLVTCTGTDASNSFTVANAKFELQN